FFQAEDGIRDFHVTGVQTCALPICELIQLFLRKKGYEVLLAENGFKALEIIIKQELDVILLDVEMPGMQGFDICEQIRMITKVRSEEHTSELSHVKISYAVFCLKKK